MNSKCITQYGALSDSDVLYREAYVFLKKTNRQIMCYNKVSVEGDS